MEKLAIAILAIIWLRHFVAAQEQKSENRWNEDLMLEYKLNGYKIFVRPKGVNNAENNGGPVLVTVNFALRRLSNIDEDNMKYRVELTFRQEWHDERLSFVQEEMLDDETPYYTLRRGHTSDQIIWTPDTFFLNAIESNDFDLMKPNDMVRIFPGGKILYSKRVSLTLAQPMQLADFPFDRHKFILDMSSYSHTDQDIIYNWREELPVQLKPGSVHDHNFKLVRANTKRCTSELTVGRYSCLRVEFELQRRSSSSQLFQFFGPSFVLVVLSWLPFMISTPSVATRALTGLICLMTNILQIAIIGNNLPETQEFTWAHMWLITCSLFIVGAQVQLVAYVWIARIGSRRSVGKRRRKTEHERRIERPTAAGVAGTSTSEQSALLLHGANDQFSEEPPVLNFQTMFDLGCLLLFAVAFFIFNCYFWATAGAPGYSNAGNGAEVHFQHHE